MNSLKVDYEACEGWLRWTKTISRFRPDGTLYYIVQGKNSDGVNTAWNDGIQRHVRGTTTNVNGIDSSRFHGPPDKHSTNPTQYQLVT